ncbi:beta-1,3-galactosyltransferase 1-like [Mya arenaria]|uniref:beta-1,3-galactosyltransferase 1-like n=1 Tax=Mya arenaria TaxID=6604 RepID=UPI0022E1B7B9|nr:beta-1,3-galactosyltransferase 1-like [Mya arenaria]
MPGYTDLKTNKGLIVVILIVGVFIIVSFCNNSILDHLSKNPKFLANGTNVMDMVYQDVDIDLYLTESRTLLHNNSDFQRQSTEHMTLANLVTVTESSEVDDFGNIKYSSKNKRKMDCHNCFLHDFKYIIDNPNICNGNGQEAAKLFIFVFTEHSNTDKRNAIRKTWLSLSNNNTSEVRYAFLLGETEETHLRDAVLKENEIYHDIIKENFKDSYRNLTYKTILGLKWVTEKCASVKFVMKTDDDVFVNIQSLMLMLNSSKILNQMHAIFGACQLIAGPNRDSHSKWYASVFSYPESLYPGFCSGTGYLMSSSVATALYKISPNIPFFHLEDVYIALCMKSLGYRLIPTTGFMAYKSNLCEYKYMDVVTVHGIPPYNMEEIWNSQC